MSKKLREDWLRRATTEMEKLLMKPKEIGPMPKKWGVSVGWPRGSKLAIGQCWTPKVSSGGVTEMFISPALSDPVEVLATLLHEMVHAVVGIEAKHGKLFSKPARALGLDGKITATYAGPELTKALKKLSRSLGKYPHSDMSPSDALRARAKSEPWPTFECPENPKYRVQVRPKALEEFGAPTSPISGLEMIRSAGRMKRKDDDD